MSSMRVCITNWKAETRHKLTFVALERVHSKNSHQTFYLLKEPHYDCQLRGAKLNTLGKNVQCLKTYKSITDY
jgi:hypothetical protein